jgi:trk system potassium uptake protein
VHSLRRGAAEALEVIVHGDARSSKVVGRRIEEIDLPQGATIGAIVRPHPTATGGEAPGRDGTYDVLIAHHDTVIEADDHVIVFVVNRRIIPKVERLFQVSLGFF